MYGTSYIEKETSIQGPVVYLQGTSQGSQDSLDKHSSLPRMKSYDAAVFDVLKVPAEEFAVSIFSLFLFLFSLYLFLLILFCCFVVFMFLFFVVLIYYTQLSIKD